MFVIFNNYVHKLRSLLTLSDRNCPYPAFFTRLVGNGKKLWRHKDEYNILEVNLCYECRIRKPLVERLGNVALSLYSFRCNQDFGLAGKSYSECFDDPNSERFGRWSDRLPECRREFAFFLKLCGTIFQLG